jgi:hypothetical protein
VTRALVILLLLAGCAHAPRIESPRGTIAVSWSKDSQAGLPSWIKEIERRIGPGAIILDAHGWYDSEGRWSRIGDDHQAVPWETLVDLVRRLHPDRPIVVLSCNPRGQHLRTARVHYARGSVTQWPYASPFTSPGISTFRQFAYSGDMHPRPE